MKFMYSVFDKKSQLYAVPFIEVNDGTAIRAIQDIMRNPEHPFARYPGDYDLIRVGEWSDETCVITQAAPVNIIEFGQLKEVSDE